MTAPRMFLACVAMALLTSVSVRAQNNGDPDLALGGFDVVSYFQDGGPLRGKAEFREDFDGARYLFANAQNKAAFRVDPDRYLPQFSGLCVIAVSRGKEAKGDPAVWKIVDGKLYLFASDKALAKAEREPETLTSAHRVWSAKH